jgi:hypothetical protein
LATSLTTRQAVGIVGDLTRGIDRSRLTVLTLGLAALTTILRLIIKLSGWCVVAVLLAAAWIKALVSNGRFIALAVVVIAIVAIVAVIAILLRAR